MTEESPRERRPVERSELTAVLRRGRLGTVLSERASRRRRTSSRARAHTARLPPPPSRFAPPTSSLAREATASNRRFTGAPRRARSACSLGVLPMHVVLLDPALTYTLDFAPLADIYRSRFAKPSRYATALRPLNCGARCSCRRALRRRTRSLGPRALRRRARRERTLAATFGVVFGHLRPDLDRRPRLE